MGLQYDIKEVMLKDEFGVKGQKDTWQARSRKLITKE